MKKKRRAVALFGITALAIAAAPATPSSAFGPGGPLLTAVPSANTKSDGYAPSSVLSPELSQSVVAQGSTRLENSSDLTSYYGYGNDVLNSAGEPQMLPIPSLADEAQKTEPDKNTYLTFRCSDAVATRESRTTPRVTSG